MLKDAAKDLTSFIDQATHTERIGRAFAQTESLFVVTIAGGRQVFDCRAGSSARLAQRFGQFTSQSPFVGSIEMLELEHLSIETCSAIECKCGADLYCSLLEKGRRSIHFAGAEVVVCHKFKIIAAFRFNGSSQSTMVSAPFFAANSRAHCLADAVVKRLNSRIQSGAGAANEVAYAQLLYSGKASGINFSGAINMFQRDWLAS